MITEEGTHWIEAGDVDVTIGIAGEPGNWIVTLRRGKVILASSQASTLEAAFIAALESSDKLVRMQERFQYPSARGM